MSNILESEEIFEAHARIDCSYFMLQNLAETNQESNSPIETMIDISTGYAKLKQDKIRSEAVKLIKGIIKDKKIISADFSNDEKVLSELKKMDK